MFKRMRNVETLASFFVLEIYIKHSKCDNVRREAFVYFIAVAPGRQNIIKWCK